MSTRDMGVSGAFQNLAAVVEPFETSQTNFTVTNATPVSKNLLEQDSVAVEITVQIPFLDDGLEDSQGAVANLTPNDVRIQSDGSLHVELTATAARKSEIESPVTPEQSPPDDEEQHDADTELESEDDESGTEASDENSEPNTSVATDTTAETRSASQEADEPESETGGSTAADADSRPAESNGSNENQPAYRDPNRLQEAYENYDTFTEMTDALDVDVTPQTVRRYMIEYDIHEPSSNTTSQSINTLLEANPDSFPLKSDQDQNADENGHREAELESEPSAPTRGNDTEETIPVSEDSGKGNSDKGNEGTKQSQDTDRSSSNTDATSDAQPDATTEEKYEDLVEPEEVELPSHLTLDDIKETVQNAKTLYEAQQQLELPRDQTQELLQELNLLDLVQSRLSSRDHQKRTREEINQRIRARASSEGA